MSEKKIFISYRRDDSAGQAGRMKDRLARELGDNAIFMDVDGIPLGVDFVKRLTAEVAACDILLAVIGPQWGDILDEKGRRRLEDPNDFVRVEIGAALQRDIPVVPILLEGTRIPRAEELPSELRSLAVRNGLNVRHSSFHSDLDRLVRELSFALSNAPLNNAEKTGDSTEKSVQSISLEGSPASSEAEWRSAGDESGDNEFGLWLFGTVIGLVIGFGLMILMALILERLLSSYGGARVDVWIAEVSAIVGVALAGVLFKRLLGWPMLMASIIVATLSVQIGMGIMVTFFYGSATMLLGLFAVPVFAVLFLRLRQSYGAALRKPEKFA